MVITVHPNNKRASIPEDSLRELYVAQGLTLEAVAVTFAVAGTTIRRRLRDLGILVRSRGPSPKCSFLAEIGGGKASIGTWTRDLAYVVVPPLDPTERAASPRLVRTSHGADESEASRYLAPALGQARVSQLDPMMYHAADVPALRRKRERAERAIVGATWYRHPLSDAETLTSAGVE